MKSRAGIIATAFSVLVAGAAGAGIALGVASALGDFRSTTTVVSPGTQTPTSLRTTGGTSGKALNTAEIYARTSPGVVQVTTKTIVKSQANPFFPAQSQTQEALGSGFVIDKQGDIVTNYHVIQGANSIEVTFSNNATTKATVVGTDKSTDLAVLRVKISPDALTPLAFGDSSTAQVGDPVVAIGNPFGLDRTATSGIVSAIYNVGDNTLSGSSYPLVSQNHFQIPAIQTDAAINHGNSGGPLLNSLGQVLGVNSQIETAGGTSQGNVGIGFAVQSNTVKQVVAQLLRSGKATHAYLGVRVWPITPDLARLYRLPVKAGLLVEEVVPRTGAANAGLKAGTHKVTVSGTSYRIGGDIIVGIGGKSVSTYAELENIIAAHKPGDKLPLEIYRGSKKMTVSVTLGNRS